MSHYKKGNSSTEGLVGFTGRSKIPENLLSENTGEYPLFLSDKFKN